MESLLFALGAILPIIFSVVAGYLLKRIGLFPKEMAKPLNKLIFRIFLPAMLFLNVYKIESFQNTKGGYILYAALITLLIFVFSIPVTTAITKRSDRRGVLLQACFRSNQALIGVALAQSLYGEAGVKAAALLSAFLIPIYNVLAVLSLSVFQKQEKKGAIKRILKDIVKNPLILSVLAGLLLLIVRGEFQRFGITFRLSDLTPLMKFLESLSALATPLSLLVLGVQFEFSAVPSLKKEIIFGTFMRTFAVPLIAIGTAVLLFRDSFDGAQFAVLIAVFATPVAVSSVPMSQEMNGDATLAGQLVVWTTLLSSLTVFLASFLLKLIGIFA